VKEIDDTDPGNWIQFGIFGEPGQALLAAIAANNDTVDHVVQVGVLTDPGKQAVIACAIVPAGAGFDGAPVVDLLAVVYPRPGGLFQTFTDGFYVRVPVTPSSTTIVTFYALLGTF
jgi:hypothetical protein